MATRTQKIKRKSKDANHLTNKESIKTIADNCAGSTSTTLAAAGTLTSGKAVDLGDAITDNTNKKSASTTATKTEKTANGVAVDNFNLMATAAELAFPNNPTMWESLGFDVTEATTTDAVKCPAATDCSVSQGEASGTADVHHDPIPGSDHNQVLVTNGLATDRASYIDVTNPDESASKSNHTVNLGPAYLGVPLFWIIVGSNVAGDGFDSTPFGGGKKIN
jgi:hypothetical protein